MFRSKKKCTSLGPDPNVTSDNSKTRNNDDDVFTELLAGASTAGTLDQKFKQSHHASNCMTIIDLGSAVLFEPSLRTFLPIGDKIVCCGVSEESCVLSTFHQITPDSGLDTLAYAPLPAVKMTVNVSSAVTSLQKSRQRCYWNYRPQFLCLQPGNSVSCLLSCAAIERSFFNKLFNSDASLLDSPVIIFGGQDGQLFYWPVNSFALTSTSSERLGAKQAYTPQLLYHLEQGVSAIYPANLHCQEASSGTGPTSVTSESESSVKHKKKPSSDCYNAAVFVGDRDKLVIASEGKALSHKGRTSPVDFTEHSILGPVLCSCLSSTGDSLVHSTGKEIFITKLSVNGKHDAMATTVASLPTFSPTALTTVSMQIPNVSAVCCVNKKSKMDGVTVNRQDKVYALTVSGKLLQFHLPGLEDGDSLIDSNVSPQMAGEKVKNCLSEIEAQSADLAKVNAAIESEDRVLKELNTVIHIACQMGEGTTASEQLRMDRDRDALPVSCSFTPSVSSYESSGTSSVTLQCKIVNQGTLPLSSCWSLVIHIQGKEPWLHRVTRESTTLGRSVPLQSLNPGSFLEIDIPIGKSLASSFHVVAEAHLYCNLNSILADLSVDLDSGNLSTKTVEDVMIPISRQVLDILHFVTPYQPGSRAPVPSIVPGSKEELLQTLDKLDTETQHAALVGDLSPDSKAMNTDETLHGSHSATFQVSQDAVNFMKNATLAQKSTQATTQHAVVLQFIMRDSSIVKQRIDAECSYMDLLTVNGSRASINVKPVSGGVMPSSDGPSVEVALLCSSVPLLCRLHEAVVTRLKVSL